ncbi:MAG: 16S rRNA (cytidine(1402)-2'-O)-methyltransferase [Candidatus Puniceispirillum sp.]|nr:16S rRNA (cytidine(1402)-2'-O)-methyltransferase [Candidatus Puniceispirillum sp.]
MALPRAACSPDSGRRSPTFTRVPLLTSGPAGRAGITRGVGTGSGAGDFTVEHPCISPITRPRKRQRLLEKVRAISILCSQRTDHDPKGTVTHAESKHEGILFLVATPIGNLADISKRALETLTNADIIVCEDSRVTRKLFTHFGLHPKELWTYHEHNAAAMRPRIVDAVGTGKHVALVSDAGTPLISDPGYKLVRALQDAGLKVTSVPGANAALCALILSGLPCDQFFFGGFPPRKSGARQTFFGALKGVPGTLIFYESPRRLRACLQDLHAALGEREVAYAREITKYFETIERAPITLFLEREDLDNLKGELVLLVGPRLETTPDQEDIRSHLEKRMEDLSLKDAVKEVATQLGLSRQLVYSVALDLREERER